MDSIVLYASQYELVKGLSDEQLGKLLRAIFLHNRGEQVSFGDDGLLAMAFGFIQDGIERAFAEKRRISELRSDAGKKGGAPVGNQNARKKDETSKTSKTNKNKQKQAKTSNALFSAQNVKNQTFPYSENAPVPRKNAPKEFSADTCMMGDSDEVILITSKREASMLSSDTKQESKQHACAREETPLALEFDEPAHEKTRFEKFQDFLKDECPYIYEHLKPLTEPQFQRLLNTFGAEIMCTVCRNIENRGDLRKNYKCLYPTMNNWGKLEVKRRQAEEKQIVR